MDSRVFQTTTTTSGIISSSSGPSVLLDSFQEPDGSIVSKLLSLVVPATPRPSFLVLHVARFVGHMFLVLRVLPTMLDISRAVVTWGLSLHSHSFGETANVFIRTAAFLSTILLTVGMLFIVSVRFSSRSAAYSCVMRFSTAHRRR
jgi:hypothetical protein